MACGAKRGLRGALVETVERADLADGVGGQRQVSGRRRGAQRSGGQAVKRGTVSGKARECVCVCARRIGRTRAAAKRAARRRQSGCSASCAAARAAAPPRQRTAPHARRAPDTPPAPPQTLAPRRSALSARRRTCSSSASPARRPSCRSAARARTAPPGAACASARPVKAANVVGKCVCFALRRAGRAPSQRPQPQRPWRSRTA